MRILSPFVLCLAVSLFLGGPAVPQSPAPAVASSRVGVVNIQDAIQATQEGKKEFDALQTRFKPRQDALKALNDEVDAMKKDLQARAASLNEEARNRQRKALEAKQKTLQHDFESAQDDFQKAEQEVVTRIGKKMLDVVEDYSRTHGYDVILDVSNPQAPVLWASSRTVITKELLDAYDSKYPVK